MGTNEKCKAIIEKIIAMSNEIPSHKTPVISFAPDWGGNSLTICVEGKGHTHCGDPNASFDQLVEELHMLLCEGKGLSFA